MQEIRDRGPTESNGGVMVRGMMLPFLIFALLLASVILAQEESQQQALVRLEHEWGEAYQHRNSEWFRNHLSDNFTFTGWDRQFYNKNKYIAAINRQVLEYYKIEDVTTSLSGDTGVVTLRSYWKYDDSKGATRDVRSTDVFRKQQGRWLLTASQDRLSGK